MEADSTCLRCTYYTTDSRKNAVVNRNISVTNRYLYIRKLHNMVGFPKRDIGFEPTTFSLEG